MNEAGLDVPRLLAERGVPHLIAPILTATGAPFDADEPSFIVFPFVDGVSGGAAGMAPGEWRELGRTMRAIHDVAPDPAFTAIMRVEDFVPTRIEMLHEVQTFLGSAAADADATRRELASFWRAHRSQIDRVVERTETLAPVARERAGPDVICHGDIHAWNVMVTPEHDIVIIDWDSAILAPRERDLMFVDGVAGGHAADPVAFSEGYGDVDVDPSVMAYYRIEWAVQDLAEFGASVALDHEADAATRAESLEAVFNLFAPGSEIDGFDTVTS